MCEVDQKVVPINLAKREIRDHQVNFTPLRRSCSLSGLAIHRRGHAPRCEFKCTEHFNLLSAKLIFYYDFVVQACHNGVIFIKNHEPMGKLLSPDLVTLQRICFLFCNKNLRYHLPPYRLGPRPSMIVDSFWELGLALDRPPVYRFND